MRQVVWSFLKYGFVIGLALIMSGPVVTALLGSLRTSGEFVSQPFGLPRNGIQWQNYTDILTSQVFWRQLGNSLIITLGAMVISVILASLLSFIFARVEFQGRKLWFNVLMIGLLFPLGVAILPLFIQLLRLDLVDSYWGIILPIATFATPSNTVILTNFFSQIPRELEDASYIDGCTRFGFFRYILLPMARPSITAVATLVVVHSWNEFFLPLIVLNDPDKWPLPLGVMQYQGQFGTDWARVMAFVMLLIIPAVLFYIVAEKYIVTGLTGGELKG
jgi:raffinose/stachyose/melibiose transport system permease protein